MAPTAERFFEQLRGPAIETFVSQVELEEARQQVDLALSQGRYQDAEDIIGHLKHLSSLRGKLSSLFDSFETSYLGALKEHGLLDKDIPFEIVAEASAPSPREVEVREERRIFVKDHRPKAMCMLIETDRNGNFVYSDTTDIARQMLKPEHRKDQEKVELALDNFHSAKYHVSRGIRDAAEEFDVETMAELIYQKFGKDLDSLRRDSLEDFYKGILRKWPKAKPEEFVTTVLNRFKEDLTKYVPLKDAATLLGRNLDVLESSIAGNLREGKGDHFIRVGREIRLTSLGYELLQRANLRVPEDTKRLTVKKFSGAISDVVAEEEKERKEKAGRIQGKDLGNRHEIVLYQALTRQGLLYQVQTDVLGDESPIDVAKKNGYSYGKDKDLFTVFENSAGKAAERRSRDNKSLIDAKTQMQVESDIKKMIRQLVKDHRTGIGEERGKFGPGRIDQNLEALRFLRAVMKDESIDIEGAEKLIAILFPGGLEVETDGTRILTLRRK